MSELYESDAEEGEVQVAIGMIVDAAGTDKERVLNEAGKIIATLLRKNADLESQVYWLEKNISA